jgi:hypothetical protein
MNNTLRTGGAAASIISEEEAGDSNRKTVTSGQTTGWKLSEAPQGGRSRGYQGRGAAGGRKFLVIGNADNDSSV